MTLRVVDVTSFFGAACGGVKSYYAEKARHLPALGLDCHFVVPSDDDRPSHEPFGGARLHRLPSAPLPGTRFYRRFVGIGPLRALLDRLRPDVIELGSHYLLPDLIRAAIRGWTARRPAVVGFYHADFPRTYVAPATRRIPWLGPAAVAAAWALVRRQHARYRATLVASRHVAVALAEHGVPDVRWVGLGVDHDTFRPIAPEARTPRAHPRLVYAGRLAADKSFDVLLDAAEAIHRATGAELVVAGDGPAAPRLRRLASRHPFVRPLGTLRGRAEVAALLADADAVVAPGRHETFSLAAAEAMACGTPVVGADRGGNAEIIADAGAGVTFRAGSPDDLARAAVELLRAPAEARLALGRRGRDHVIRRYAWSQVAQRIAGVYQDVAA